MLVSALSPIIVESQHSVSKTVMKHLLLAIVVSVTAAFVSGQDELQPGLTGHNWAVFLRHNSAAPAETAVIFVDLLTGETTNALTRGERHTLIDDGVLYFDGNDLQVKLVKPDGLIREHPFLVMKSGDFRIDWAVANDGRQIAWAISRQGSDGLATSLMVADAGGSDIRQLLSYGPRPGIRLVPVAFDRVADALYVAVHVEGTEEATAYARHSGLFRLDYSAENVATSALTNDQPCFCAVGFGDDVWLRLVSEDRTSGIELEIHELSTGTMRVVPPISMGSYEEAGNLLVSSDGAVAVYALSQVSGLNSLREDIRSVAVLVDLENARQMVVNYPMSNLVRPIAFTEDNSAVLLRQEGRDGTWKMQLDDGETVMVANDTFLGIIGS